MAATPRIRLAPRPVVAVLLASLAAALLVVVAMALLGEYTKTRGRFLLTALSLAGFCAVALAPSALYQRGRHLPVAATGLMVSLLGFLLVAAGTWATPDPYAYWKATAILSILAVSISHASWLLVLEPRRPLARAVSWSTLGAASLVAALASLAIILEVKAAPYWWVVSILVIVQIAGGVAAPALCRWISPVPGVPRPAPRPMRFKRRGPGAAPRPLP